MLSCALIALGSACAGISSSTSAGAGAVGGGAGAPGPASNLATSEQLAAPLPGDPMAVTIHRLTNGLTVYISPDRTEPRVSAHIVVRAGSRTDPPGSTGLAHYLEHMLFKGTERLGTLDGDAERPHIERIAALYERLYTERDEVSRTNLLAEIDSETQASSKWLVPNELDRVTETLGFRGMNAMTSEDWTMYLVEVPSNRIEHWARMEAARLHRPVFRLFLPELEAVYEEKNQSIDSPEDRAFEKLNLLLYPKHPYGTQTTIGNVEHLKNPAYRHMVEYFRRWYVPNNMAVVLSGDVDAGKVLPLLERHFGAWKARPLDPPPPAELPPLTGRSFAEVEAEGEEQIFLAWQTVPGGHDDELAITVMDLMMADSKAGLINTELVLPQRIPWGASSPQFKTEAGHWLVYGTARDGQRLEEIERLLLETVAKLKAGQFDDKDLAAAILNEDIREKREIESNGARAMRMASAFSRREPWSQVASRSTRLRALTRADIVRVANKYLGPGFAVVYRRKGKLDRPKLTKPRISPIAMDASRQSVFARELGALPVTALEPKYLREGVDYQRARLPAGKLLAAPNPRNDLFALSYRFELGYRRQPLLCHAIQVQQTAGAGALSASAFQKQLYALGATVSVDCGADETHVQVEGVDALMDEILVWVDRWFREPRFDQGDVDKRLATVLTDRRNSMEDPRSAAQALSTFAAMGPRSVFLTQPSNDLLREASAGQLRGLLAAFPDHQHKTLYFGPRSIQAAAKAIGFGKAHRPVPRQPPLRYHRPGRPTIFLLDRDLAQAQLSLTFPSSQLRRDDLGKSLALSHYVGGGMHSLTFQEIREARGLAYSADAEHHLGERMSDETAMLGFLATQADKTAEALGRLLEILREMPLRDDRLAMTKTNIEERIRSKRHAPREIAQAVDGWDELGEPGDPRPRVRAQVTKLKAAEVQAYLRRQVARPFSAALTAPKARLDLANLRKRATVKEVQVEDLFSYGPFPPVVSEPKQVGARLSD
jgi:predicted Zn-dependent peptidase